MPLGTYPTWLQAKLNLAAIRQRGNILVNAKDGSLLTRVPTGVFEMGDGEDFNDPKHKVELSEYWIGVNCVINRQYARFLNEAKPCQEDERKWVLMGNHNFVRKVGARYEAHGGMEDHPVVQVSWFGAEAYAKWAGGALPTEAQWEKAAKGQLGLKYPWGKNWKPELCRSGGNKGSGTTVSVSEYPKGTSGYGTYQQSGNVCEWCRDWYEEGYYVNSPSKDPGGPASGSGRVYRGGSWISVYEGGLRAGSRNTYIPVDRYGHLGFRLVRSV